MMAKFPVRKCIFALRNLYCQKFVCCRAWHRFCSSQTGHNLKFVPRSEEPTTECIARLEEFIFKSKSLFVLTGAGISTESGIPDYRSEGVGLYSTRKTRPIQYAEFLNSADGRRRYWARNYVGWPTFSSVQPNKTHHSLRQLELAGKIHWLVTQNVDALHHKAGSERVTELHGCAHHVICLSCHNKILRHSMQERIKALNPEWHAQSMQLQMAPDGDVNLTDAQVQDFVVPHCEKCSGILKPEVVFFGDNVPRHIVQDVFTRLEESDAMLVIGSSLEVYSGYRFALGAKEQGKPIAIVNIGPTRADKFVHLKINARSGDILEQMQIRF